MVDVVSCAPESLRGLRRGAVAMVFQQFALLPWRSVVENVALGLELAGMAKEERLAKAREVLATVNLTDWAEKKVSELSGGMQQRVGLARAFATDAEILLMDEPFSALDPLIRNRLQDELLMLQDKMHCTIVFVSHDLEEAVKLGNTITIMEGGRIVQTGAPEDIVLQAGERLCRRLRRPPEPAERADRDRRDGGGRRPRRRGALAGARRAAEGGAAVLRGLARSGLGAAGRRDGGQDHLARGLFAARPRGGVGAGRRVAARRRGRRRGGILEGGGAPRWPVVGTFAAISSGTRPARTHSRYPAAIPANGGQRDARPTCGGIA